MKIFLRTFFGYRAYTLFFYNNFVIPVRLNFLADCRHKTFLWIFLIYDIWNFSFDGVELIAE